MPSVDPAELRRSVLSFVVTCVSVWAVYAFDHSGWGANWSGAIAFDASVFTASLMGILLAHELGHFLVGRAHGIESSPPTFMPFPVPGSFGTMGALIRLRSLPRSRQALLEMGAAGPLAGALVAFAVLLVGVPRMIPGPLIRPGTSMAIYNDPLIVKLIGLFTLGEYPGRYDVYHPAALAGWVGCLLTGINLLPIGQLDGGHVLNALLPRAARWVARVLLAASLVGAWFYAGWLVWAVLLLVLGAHRPANVPAEPPLPLRSRVVALLTLVLFVLTFVPIPVEIETFPPP